MLFNGMYVDRSEPIGNMRVLLHLLQEDHTERYGRIDVDQQCPKDVCSLMQQVKQTEKEAERCAVNWSVVRESGAARQASSC